MQIIPAVLATSEEQYQKDIYKLNSTHSLKGGWVHIDFMDNIFVQNKSIQPEVIKKFPVDFQKEAHLMVSHPKEWIDKLIDAGFERIIFHIECEDNIEELIDYIESKGITAGLALKIDTSIEKLAAFINKIAVILLMSIEAGFQGHPFIPETFDKIRQLKSKNWGVKFGIDGAVKDDNIKEVMNAGADFVIAGSYLLEGDTEENLERLWEVIHE